MVYQGSKASLMKDLAPIINGLISEYKFDYYVEPFVGGANSFVEINHPNRIGFDNNKYLIALLNHLMHEELNVLEFIDKKTYLFIIHHMHLFEDWFIGFIGFVYSFRGIFRGGYSNRHGTFKEVKQRINNLNKQRFKLSIDDLFIYKNFYDINLYQFKTHLIYLDPPYMKTVGYRQKTDYTFEKLEEKCAEWKRLNPKNMILLSERSLINNGRWKIIWCKEIYNNIQNKKEKVIEFLYQYIGD